MHETQYRLNKNIKHHSDLSTIILSISNITDIENNFHNNLTKITIYKNLLH